MAHSKHQYKTPVARGGFLSYPTIVGEIQVWTTVRLGSPEWFAWLETAQSFFYEVPAGGFTARRETKQRGGAYWYGYRQYGQRQYKRYIGKPENVTLERLHEVWEKLRTANKKPANREEK